MIELERVQTGTGMSQNGYQPEPSVSDSQVSPNGDLGLEADPPWIVETEELEAASEQPLPSIVTCTRISSQGNEDGEERSSEEGAHSEPEVVPIKPRRKYPYAAMFFIMAAVVGQRYIKGHTAICWDSVPTNLVRKYETSFSF